MAITFNNIIFDDIIETLATIINDEFSIPIFYDEHKGNHSFLFTPEADNFVAYLSGGVQREYNILISYELKTGGQYTKNNIKQVSNIIERLKRLVVNNVVYSNGAKWVDANISSIEYERNEDDQSILKATSNFNCNNIEVI